MPKEGIHPKYETINVKCACGNKFETRSTNKGDIFVEICAHCHPFFNGKQKLVDTAGRVERFRYRKVAGSDSRQGSSQGRNQNSQPIESLARGLLSRGPFVLFFETISSK